MTVEFPFRFSAATYLLIAQQITGESNSNLREEFLRSLCHSPLRNIPFQTMTEQSQEDVTKYREFSPHDTPETVSSWALIESISLPKSRSQTNLKKKTKK